MTTSVSIPINIIALQIGRCLNILTKIYVLSPFNAFAKIEPN